MKPIAILDVAMAVTVREATPEDAMAIPAIHNAAIELAREAYDDEVIEAWQHDRDPEDYPIEDEDAYFVVAKRSTDIVGFGELRPEAGEYLETAVEGEIGAIYVRPSAVREGVGAAIYADLERRARELNIGSLGLWASVNAVPFYEAQGFETTVELTHEFGGEVEGPAVEMRKDL